MLKPSKIPGYDYQVYDPDDLFPAPAGMVREKSGHYTMLRLDDDTVISRLSRVPNNPYKSIILDYFSPNLSKQFHIGHLRNILIGDCLTRILIHCGYSPVLINHAGDTLQNDPKHMTGFLQQWNSPMQSGIYRPESSYRNDIPPLCGRIGRLDGQQWVIDGINHPLPLTKSGGTPLYLANDIAALQYRQSDEIWYITDDRQSDHFAELSMINTRYGLTSGKIIHIPYGIIADKTGKPLKSRDGTALLVSELLSTVSAVKPETLPDSLIQSSIRFAILSVANRTAIRIDNGNLFSFDGKTALYCLYAIARLKAIRGDIGGIVYNPIDRDILFEIGQYSGIVESAIANYNPAVIADGLYSLCRAIHKWYGLRKIGGDLSAISIAKKCIEAITIYCGFLGLDIEDTL